MLGWQVVKEIAGITCILVILIYSVKWKKFTLNENQINILLTVYLTFLYHEHLCTKFNRFHRINFVYSYVDVEVSLAKTNICISYTNTNNNKKIKKSEPI